MSAPIQFSRIRILTVADARQPEQEIVWARFRQTLQDPPRDDESLPSMAELAAPAPAPCAPPDDASSARRRDELSRLQQAASIAMRHAGTGESTEDIGAAMQHRIARALIREHRTETVIDSLAHRVAEFCQAPTIAGGGTWEVRLSIDPGVLPQTSLLLRLVERQLQLQFDCRDLASGQLLREHRTDLARKLIAALRAPYDIDIQVF